MNIIKLITDASIVVQLILLMLLFFSVFSWAIIIFKRRMLRGAAAQSQKFLNAFHRSKNLTEVGEAARKYKLSPHAALFQAGYKELAYFTKSNPNTALSPARIDTLNRALQKAANQEIARMERMMSFLATTGQRHAVHRPLRDGLGDHGRLLPHRRRPLGQPRHRRPGHRRGPHRHGRRPLRRHPGGHRLQLLPRPDQGRHHGHGRFHTSSSSPSSSDSMGISASPLPSASRKRQIGTSLSEINVTPFIDVMLVLLIIFMVTAPMMQSGIGVALPRAETDSAPAEEGLTLTVTPDKYVHIDGSVININLLERRLQGFFAGKTKKIVYIKADEDLPYGVIVSIMDIAKKAGVETIGLVTEPIEPLPARRR